MNNNSSSQRKLTVYERNQLLRAKLTEADLLSKGEMPVEYLTGKVDFKGLDLKVNQHVLIPRVETEDLVDLVVTDLKSQENKEFNFLELGVGSGAISLAILDYCLKNNKRIKLSVSDYSKESLIVAKENFKRLFPDFKVSFFENDLLTGFKSAEKFNLIVANLPYIPHFKMANLAESVKDFEPHLALDGGDDGFVLIARFLDQILAGQYLTMEGKIFLEVDLNHTQEFVNKNYPNFLNCFNCQWHKDHLGRNRFIVLSLKSV